MANLDTREKRASGVSFDQLYLTNLPLPDGTIGVLDRQQVAHKYSGIDTSTAAGTTPRLRMLTGMGL